MKPTTGGGIYYSLVSAALAADVLAEPCPANDLSARRLAPYERRGASGCRPNFRRSSSCAWSLIA